jgi:hypothetical protein
VTADVRFWWRDRGACRRFRTGVSLHSHTLHSRECLNFIPHHASKNRLLAWLVRREARRHGFEDVPAEAFARAWWTPPLSPRAAWNLERAQIEEGLGTQALVSITDHDSIDASAELRAVADSRRTPVSLEWTAPYYGSFLHLGVHNLPAPDAPAIVDSMNRYTAGAPEKLLCEVLHAVSEDPETLIVLNHPLWDCESVGAGMHRFALGRMLGRHGDSIHALEFNADRPWRENLETLDLARANHLPVVGGGDRHGCQAGPIANSTDATEFAEFVREVRGGRSIVALLPRIREPRKLRLVETAFDLLRDHPDHSRGWVHWTDRVFYTRQDGAAASLSDLWRRRQPSAVEGAINLVRLLPSESMRPALRWALADKYASL